MLKTPSPRELRSCNGDFWGNFNNYFDLDTLTDCQAHYFVDDIYVSIDSMIGINEYVLQERINIYPNPAKDYLHVNIKNLGNKIIAIKIYDLLGIQKARYTLPAGRVELPELKAGVYIIELNFSEKKLFQKVIITN